MSACIFKKSISPSPILNVVIKILMYLSAKLEAEIFRGGYPARILFVQVFTFSQVEPQSLLLFFSLFAENVGTPAYRRLRWLRVRLWRRLSRVGAGAAPRATPTPLKEPDVRLSPHPAPALRTLARFPLGRRSGAGICRFS